jgi:hypothetical protein
MQEPRCGGSALLLVDLVADGGIRCLIVLNRASRIREAGAVPGTGARRRKRARLGTPHIQSRGLFGSIPARRHSAIDRCARAHNRTVSATVVAIAGDLAAPDGVYPPQGGANQPGMPFNLLPGKVSQAGSSS